MEAAMRRAVLALAFLALPAGAFAACPPPPAAQRDIIADSYYDDPPVYSHIDPVKHAAYEAAVGPIEHYMGEVAKLASSGSRDDARCAVLWLTAWAEGDALLGKIKKEQAHYERKWVLAGLALSYAKVRHAASRDQRASIDAWLQAIADGVMKHSAAYKGERNNHYYWEGLAVAATGAVTGNARDLEWGRKVFAYAETQIAADGTLPREMKRGARALHYHLFSAAPLAMLESILNEYSPKMEKLAQFCIKARTDPAAVEKHAGVPQIGVLEDDYDWLAVYAFHHGWPGLMISLGARKPYVDRLGGALDRPNPLEHHAAH
jgi:poly(beta-D-mannuronate) lyase